MGQAGVGIPPPSLAPKDYKLNPRYSHMLNLIGPSSHLHFTSLSSTSIPPLQNYLSSSSSPSSSSSSASSDPGPSSKAKLHTMPILSLLDTLHSNPSRVCLLDPRATQVISPSDGETFDFFLYGGILGDDPPRDRTGELRKLGFEGRHLGPVQMTTDTAVGVTKRVVEDKGGLMVSHQLDSRWIWSGG